MNHMDIYPRVKFAKEQLSKNAEIAYCLSKSMIPELDDYLDFCESKKNDLLKVEENLKRLRQSKEECKINISNEKAKCKELKAQLKNLKLSLLELIHKPWKFFLIRWIWFLFFGRNWKSEYYQSKDTINNWKKDYNLHKSILNRKIVNLKKIESDTNESNAQRITLINDIDELQAIPKILYGVGEVNIPIFPMQIKQKEVNSNNKTTKMNIFTFVDLFSETKKFNIPHLEVNIDEVIKELDFIESFRTDDVLIPPNAEEKEQFGDAEELIGKEKELYTSIQVLKDMIEKTNTEQCNLPILSTNDPIRSFIQTGIDMIESGAGIQNSENVAEDLLKSFKKLGSAHKLLSNFLNKEFEKIVSIDNKINLLKEKVKEIHQKTSILRKESSEFLAEYLKNMTHYSDLVSNYYYCPKCNITEKYMEEVIGFSFDAVGDFNELTTEELRNYSENFLKGEVFSDNLGSRMSKLEKEEILNSWDLAFTNLYNLEEEIIFLTDQATKTKSNVYKLSIMRELKTKKNLYQKIVKTMLISHRSAWSLDSIDIQPGEDLSIDLFKNTKEYYNRNTKLLYKIDTENWVCPYCETEYDSETARLGSATRIVYDLEIPVLNTLWNDEKVWEKLINLHKDISREHRDRMVQEAESIQGRIDQFLSDSRQIRQLIQDKYAKSSAAIKNVDNIEAKFSQFDLLDDKTITELREIGSKNSAKLLEIEQLMHEMNDSESNLGKIPKSIAFESMLSMNEHLIKNIQQFKIEEK